MKLQNKVAIITGGAMGNGLGIAKVFLKEGAKIAILDYDEKINETVNNLRNQDYDVLGYKVDIRDVEKVNAVIKDIHDKWGNIDVLVNNAGVCRL